jgi:integrase/recombinase XerD
MDDPLQLLISHEIQSFLIDRRARHCAITTVEFYSDGLRQFCAWALTQDAYVMADLTPELLRNYLLHLEAIGRNPGGCHAAFRCIKAFLLWWEGEADPEGWRNPVRKLQAPKISLEPLPGLALPDFVKMVQVCERDFYGIRDRAIMMVLLDSGCRRAELIAINVNDLNTGTGEILILHGKGNKRRSVYIGSKSRRAVARYLRKRGSVTGNDPLWITRAGTRMSEEGLRQVIVHRAKQAGMEKAPGLHDFRRAFALNCLRNGMDTFTLKRLMGHESLVILERYLALVQGDLSHVHERHGPVDNIDLDQ